MKTAITPIDETTIAAAVEPRTARVRAFLALSKPGITRMVLLTTAVGFYMAAGSGIELGRFLHMLFGTALAAAGANALNQWRERDADARMWRTARRPIPAGTLSAADAFTFAAGIGTVGVFHVLLFVDALAALLVAASLLSYVLIYTPLKRTTPFATEIGGVPGALPILAGWVAGGGSLRVWDGWILFAILFLWQLPHFFALAWAYRDDYRRGGFRIRSTVDPDGRTTAVLTAAYTTLLLFASLLPTLTGLAGFLYLAGAAVLGAAFLALTLAPLAGVDDARARRIFIASIAYLPLLLTLLVLDRS